MFVCSKCEYTTDVKSNYIRHVNRKTDCSSSTSSPSPPTPVKKRSLRYVWLFLSLIGVIKMSKKIKKFSKI
jgi:uncharacterized C2H2 Zn-finger protein